MSRSYSDLTLKLLFGLSGHVCPFPGCSNLLIETSGGQHDPVVLGEIAHIEASSDDGPRPNPTLSTAERNAYPNLVLLCAHHHSLADAVTSIYTVEEMQRWKATGEQVARERLIAAVSNVTFAELKIICDGIAQSNAPMPSTPFAAVPPKEKMKANDLSGAISFYMTVGLAQAPLVGEYLQSIAGIVPGFPQQLRSGFVAEYERIRGGGVVGDALFLELWEFAAGSVTTPQATESERWLKRSSALTVLCHLFEVCDVFEAPA